MEDLDPWLLQLHPHDDRQDAADHPRHDGEDEIHGPDVLVVGRIDIAPPPDGVIRMLARDSVLVCHPSATSLDAAAGARGSLVVHSLAATSLFVARRAARCS